MAVPVSERPALSQVRTAEPLFWVSSAGHEIQPDTDYFYDCRRRQDRPHICLQYTLSGCGFYADRRGRVLLPAGSAFLRIIPGPFQYGFAPESGRPYELLYLSLHGSAAMQWYRRMVAQFGHVLRFTADDPIGPMLRDFVPRDGTGAPADRYLLSSQVYHLLMMIHSLHNRTRMQTHPRTAQALEMIARSAPHTQFNVQQLAEHLDCSREYLSRQFRQAMGVSPSHYLLQHRLKLAARLMRQTPDKLDLIARRSGFSGANYLCRVFKEQVGVTCATFRAQPWIAGP